MCLLEPVEDSAYNPLQRDLPYGTRAFGRTLPWLLWSPKRSGRAHLLRPVHPGRGCAGAAAPLQCHRCVRARRGTGLLIACSVTMCVFRVFPPLLMACPFFAAPLCPLFPRIGNVRAQLMHILGTAYFHLGKLLLATDAYTVVSPCERRCRFAWKRGKALQSMFGSDSGICTRL